MKTKLALSALLFIFAPLVYSQAKTITYTYDAAGRLTFVTDSVNGNRDYDYDPAGNRTEVAVGTTIDDVPPSPLPAPTLPPGSCRQIAAGAWQGSWNAVPGAAAYLYRTEAGNEFFISTRQSAHPSLCYSVRACRTLNIASCDGHFARFDLKD